MYKAIFWDNDGILVDTEGIYYRANADVLHELGIDLPIDDYIELNLKSGKSAFDLAKEQGYNDTAIEELRERRNQHFSELLKESKERLLIPGVRETIIEMKEFFTMGIVTSCLKPHFEIIHQGNGLLEHFDFILSNGDYESSKPAPDPYLAALKVSGFRKSECLIVEDSERGLRSARAAGIKCVIIPNSMTMRGNFSKAEKVFDNISELKQYLLESLDQ